MNEEDFDIWSRRVLVPNNIILCEFLPSIFSSNKLRVDYLSVLKHSLIVRPKLELIKVGT